MIRPLPGPEIYDGIETLGLKDDAQGWHSNDEIFSRLISETNPNTIIECGSWKGASAINMARITSLRASPGVDQCKIYCVDTWLGGIDHDLTQNDPLAHLPRDRGYPRLYFQFLHNVNKAGFHDRIIPIPQTSINGARFLDAHKIQADLIYVDGSHEAFDPYEDMCAYWPLLRPGGVLFGDDMQFPGVCVSYMRFVLEMGRPFKPETVGDSFWIIRKPV